MCSDRSTAVTAAVSFLIRISTDQSLVGSSPWLIAATHVLHRLQAPRHPPLALCSLENKDARARYGILKDRGPAYTYRCGRDKQEAGHSGRHCLSANKELMLLVNGTEVFRYTFSVPSEDQV